MPGATEGAGDPAHRTEAWGAALDSGGLPSFVIERLGDAAVGRTPWLSTMSPAELLVARSHGIRPVATVSGTCWYHFGCSWTEGHAEGWHKALARMRAEAIAAGANAVVDVTMRTITRRGGQSMDFTVIGTAVRVDGLPPSRDPVIATVTTLEFVRLLEAGIVPTGIAIGACYDWLAPSRFSVLTGGYATTTNMHWKELSTFWEAVRDRAIAELRRDTARLGNGVLAYIDFGQIVRQGPAGENQPPMFLGRWIVIGTVIDTPTGAAVPHDVATVIDMRDDRSPLHRRGARRHTAYGLDDEEGAI